MSVAILGLVFRSFPKGGGDFALALALADHAHDDGTNIYPTVAALALKSRQSERTVQRQLRAFTEAGWLITMTDGKGGRQRTQVYRINPDWIERAQADKARRGEKGVKLTPFSTSNARRSSPVEKRGRSRTGATRTIEAPLSPAAAGSSHTELDTSDRRTEIADGAAKGCQVVTVSHGTKGDNLSRERVTNQVVKGDNRCSPSFPPSYSPSYSPSEPSVIKPPSPFERGPNALTRSGRRERATERRSLIAWIAVCAQVDRTRQSEGLTWADARRALADELAHSAIEQLGGYARIADRTTFNQREIKGLFREHYQQLLEARGVDAA